MLPRGRMQALFLVDTGDLAQPLPDACIVVLSELNHEFRLHAANSASNNSLNIFLKMNKNDPDQPPTHRLPFSQNACKRALHLVKVACPHQPLKHQEIPRGNAPLHEPQCKIEESPNASSPASQQPDLAPGFRPSQQTHESVGFVRPTPADFDSQDDKPRSATRAHQIGVTVLLRSPSSGKSDPIFVRSSSSNGAITMEGADECCVHRQLGASEQRQPIDDNFQSPAIPAMWFVEIQIVHESVGCDTASCLTTDASGHFSTA